MVRPEGDMALIGWGSAYYPGGLPVQGAPYAGSNSGAVTAPDGAGQYKLAVVGSFTTVEWFYTWDAVFPTDPFAPAPGPLTASPTYFNMYNSFGAGYGTLKVTALVDGAWATNRLVLACAVSPYYDPDDFQHYGDAAWMSESWTTPPVDPPAPADACWTNFVESSET